jgi:hypothetical protein
MTFAGFGPRRDSSQTARVKAMVADLVDGEDITVLVAELACSEPGCPPVETVIALLSPSGNTQYKVHKPVAEVNLDDVRSALEGGAPHD